MSLEFTNIKDKTGRYSALFTNTNQIGELVLEPEKEHKDTYQYIERFKPNEKFSFTIDNATIDKTLFECSPEVTFTSTKPIIEPTPDINDLMAELKELKTRVNRTVALVHNCQKCGASLEVDEHKSIFCCKYCGATYLLGSIQPNSVYN